MYDHAPVIRTCEDAFIILRHLTQQYLLLAQEGFYQAFFSPAAQVNCVLLYCIEPVLSLLVVILVTLQLSVRSIGLRFYMQMVRLVVDWRLCKCKGVL